MSRSHGIDAVLILGKELRVDPERAHRELRARAAAASVAWRNGARFVGTLEACLRGQARPGSDIVCDYLRQLEVPEEAWVVDRHTRSTREEVVAAARLVQERNLRRLGLVTAAYHLPRARRYLRRLLPPSRAEVFTPESFLQRARGLEQRWIREGIPDATTMAEEGRVERLLSLSPLLFAPGGARLEVGLVGLFRAPWPLAPPRSRDRGQRVGKQEPS